MCHCSMYLMGTLQEMWGKEPHCFLGVELTWQCASIGMYTLNDEH